jgi:hypothetical protein
MTETKTKTEFDFNDAGPQKSFDVIPANTTVSLQMTVRPGGAGDGGWLKRSADGASEGLDCEFIVVGGEFAKRKLWQLFTLHGTTTGHAEAGEISRNTLRAILESARGIKPDDKSEAAAAARKVASWADFDQVRFIARLGVRAPQGGYPAKNTIIEVVTPDRKAWAQPEQIAKPAAAASAGAAAPPAGAIARPQWGHRSAVTASSGKDHTNE